MRTTTSQAALQPGLFACPLVHPSIFAYNICNTDHTSSSAENTIALTTRPKKLNRQQTMESSHPVTTTQEALAVQDLTAAEDASSASGTTSEQQVMKQSTREKQPSSERLIDDVVNHLPAAHGEGSSDMEVPLSVPNEGDFLVQIADALSAKCKSGDDNTEEAGVDTNRLAELLSNATIRSRLRLVGRAFLEVSEHQRSALLSQPDSNTNSSTDQGVYLNIYNPLSTGGAPATACIGSAISTFGHVTSDDSDAEQADEADDSEGPALCEQCNSTHTTPHFNLPDVGEDDYPSLWDGRANSTRIGYAVRWTAPISDEWVSRYEQQSSEDGPAGCDLDGSDGEGTSGEDTGRCLIQHLEGSSD